MTVIEHDDDCHTYKHVNPPQKKKENQAAANNEKSEHKYSKIVGNSSLILE